MINFRKIIEKLPSTTQLKMFGLSQVPLIFLVNPKVEELSENTCKVKIPLNYLTRNHLKSMYFGTLAIGADTVVAVLALDVVKQYQDFKVIPIFKGMKADFLKRAEGDVVFECNAGDQIRNMIQKAKDEDCRVTEPVQVIARVPSISDEPVATFEMGFSLRVKAY